jgi:tetratricopeptide (TPR) repeat protein
VKRVWVFIFGFIIIVFVLSCSTQKNTSLSRAYHNLTAHYNVLFNGSESYKKGLKTIDQNFKDDYSRILPVFTYGNKDIAGSISGDMDVSIKKASKLITLHSIKAKPKLKKGQHLTPKEKEFYNRNEFNDWVDDAYLLMGKSHFYKLDYPNATETFNFIIHEFAKEIANYEAKIWLARINSETGEYREATNIVTTLEGDKKFPEKLKLDLFTTSADLALKQNQYESAIKSLEKALELVHKKRLKLRYTFILAQLYKQTGQLKKATEMYTRVIRKNPPYEMAFNAQINLASVAESGSRDNKSIKERLRKMLKNDKNKDYQDQIYYALGNIEMKEGNSDKALEYYKQSVKVSVNNNPQKALSCITLADYYYKQKNYVPAQAYYDSTLLYIAENYPDLDDLKIKAKSLTNLVQNLNTISTEDSLQRVAKLPEAERIRLIDGIINNLRKNEAEAKLAESQRLQDYYTNQYRKNSLQQNATDQQGKWYFYNQVAVTQGMKDFQLRWGKRRLEDNWRRKNKNAMGFGEGSGTTAPDQKETEEKKKVLDNKSREYYIQNLPLSDSLMKASTARVIDAYYNGGLVYRNELKDLPQSIQLYEKMLERFPENMYKLAVYYQLYALNKEIKNTSRSDYYKNLILNQAPESVYAKIISDPEYYKQVVDKEKEVGRFYEQTYNYYNSGNYSQVINNAQTAFNQYKNDPLLSKFAFLKALAIGKTADKMTFRNELNQVITSYPKDEVSALSKDIIAYLNVSQPETKVQEDIKVAEVIYTMEEKTTFFFALVVDKAEDVNQVVFDIINFNLDNFSNEKLELSNEDLGKKLKIILVRSFADKDKAMNYFKAFNPQVLKNIKYQTKNIFIISSSNYAIMQKQESDDSYLQFFKIHF